MNHMHMSALRLRFGLRGATASSLLACVGVHARLGRVARLSSFGGQPRNSTGRNGVFTGIAIATGLGAGAYGLIYSKFWTWPQEMRSDIRDAIKARHRKDYRTSARYFQRALDTSRRYEDPTQQLGAAYLLKISGLAIALGSVLEQIPDLGAASQVYKTALDELPRSAPEFQEYSSQPTHASVASDPNEIEGKLWMRAIQIGVRLAEIANRQGDEKREGEYLQRAAHKVRHLLNPKFWPNEGIENNNKLYSGLELPRWADKVEMAGVYERLGEYYNRKGIARLALMSYGSAREILLMTPDQFIGGRTLTSEDRCRGAMMTNNMASILATPPDGSLKEDQVLAHTLAKQALEMVEKARGNGANPECERALVAVLYNMGLMSEIASENAEAQRYFERALAVAKTSGVKEELGGTVAEAALRRGLASRGSARE
ncbi:hypothetical protein BS47DRAFT_1393009 [Hydnum rufescens UP504]|uniref:Uncharacterized protein n=1 Tax=Hydnum rufescens UP504 TaxID=1448309 RepID=A0A9P6DU18_9AGAM|nr:hypothetical protein BS47DRAFT_1393009 [Hydnum rufescens UP504]